ncbi:MAG: cytochrome b/b6 domain-containing protein [Rhodobacteraceae bacterium]|nr:cytochrome b/b6 domain-containing protein [Paracoccaceae bacterium]
MPAPKGYSARQIRLHWIVTVLIVLQFVLHEPIAEAWDLIEDGQIPAFNWLIPAHVIGGVLVLIFALWRLVLRQSRGVPPAPQVGSAALERAAHLGHIGLYALMILMPLSGLAAWFGGIDAAAEAHEVMKVALLALVGLHVLAALWHQFWLKDGLLLRMKRPAD